jgi:hypothetical protein
VSGVLKLGDLSAAPLRECFRRPGVGGNVTREIGPEGVTAGEWKLYADAGGAAWTPCITFRDLGVLHCDAGASAVHPGHGILDIPPGHWVLQGERRAPGVGGSRPGSRRAAEARELAALIGGAS